MKDAEVMEVYDNLTKRDWIIAVVGGVVIAGILFFVLAPYLIIWFINAIAN